MPQPKLKSENYSNMLGINQKLSQYLTGQNEALDLTNFDFSTPGAWTKRWGSTNIISDVVIGKITGLYEFEQLNGASQLIVTANTNAYYVSGSNYISFRSGLSDGNNFDFVTFVNRLFAFSGADSFVYDGTTARNYGLPPGGTISSGLIGAGSGTGFSGIYAYSYGYLNDRGYFGPAYWQSGNGVTTFGLTAYPQGASAVALSGFTTPSGFGITAIAIYRSTGPDGVDLFLLGYLPAGGATFVDNNIQTTTQPMPQSLLYLTLIPRYAEIYNNELFMAGFSAVPSTMYWSNIGEPEAVDEASFVEVRTNDGDRITGLKAYLSQLVIFKERSFHVLSGDNPDNFAVSQVSDQYGCLSNRAVVLYENICWFLDRKGICEYNGANVSIISPKIEPIFDSMNIDAAKENAVAVHFKQRNEVWFSIPCNGATLNNCTVVFDYVSNAWTKYEGFFPTTLAIAKNSLTVQTCFYGGYSGTVAYFGASFFGDSGNGITCIAKTRFHHDLGDSVTKQFRRLFLNINPITGSTAQMTVNLRQDYGSSIVHTKTMYFNPFQSRIDFGIPGKSLQMEFFSFSTTLSVKIFGYSIDYRYQRAV